MARYPNNPSGENRPITRAKVRDVTKLLNQGKSSRQVAAMVGSSVGSVLNIRKRIEEDIPLLTAGRPSKISPRTKEVIHRQFNTGELETPKDGQQYIQETDGVHVHVQAVRRVLQESEVGAYVQQKRPDLKPNHMQDRLKFA